MYPTTVIGIMYTVYTLLALTAFGWFSYALTRKEKVNLKFKISITSWIILLSVTAVIFHIITYTKLPWVKWEILGKRLMPKKEITVNIKDYKFQLLEDPITIRKGDPIKFTVFSDDVTYGFGVFRTDGTLVFQMQVLPARSNEITWIFQDEGKYTIRSTEYSGPENWKMVLKDTIVVME